MVDVVTSTTRPLRNRRRRRDSAVLAVIVLAAAACGGDSEGESSTTDAATAVTEPPPAVVEPLDEATADTGPGDTEPPSTEPPSPDETPIGTDDVGNTVTQEYCDALTDLRVPGLALARLDPSDTGAFEQTLTTIVERTEPVRALAPGSDTDATVEDLQIALDEFIPIARDAGFGELDIDALPDGGARLLELNGAIESAFEGFEATLIDDCGVTAGELDDLGFDFARSVAVLPVVDPDAPPAADRQPDTDSPAGGTIAVTDDTGTISVTVPAGWSDVDGTPGPNESRLVVSPDNETFLNGFGLPGMFIEAVPTPDVDGADVFPTALDSIVANYESGGCGDTVREPYADAVYTGTEAILQCVPGFDTRVIAGTNPVGDTIFVVAMVIADDDTETRQLIVDTFIVD